MVVREPERVLAADTPPLPPSGPIPGGLQRSAVEPGPGEDDDLYFAGWYTVVPDDVLPPAPGGLPWRRLPHRAVIDPFGRWPLPPGEPILPPDVARLLHDEVRRIQREAS
jgi:hypothetical protein